MLKSFLYGLIGIIKRQKYIKSHNKLPRYANKNAAILILVHFVLFENLRLRAKKYVKKRVVEILFLIFMLFYYA